MKNDTIINYNKQFDSGIYKITNTINGKVYIGQSIHLKNRMSAHRSINSESNVGLKRAYKKYGIENFTFEIIKETYDLDYWEKFYIYWYRSTNPKYGYNISIGGDTCPSKSERTRKKMSKSIKAFYASKEGKETLQEISEKRKNTIDNWSDDKKERVRQNYIDAQKKIYVLCINRKQVKYLHQWKIEDNKEITLRRKNHLVQLFGRDVILCKGEYFVSFENDFPTNEEIEMYYEKLDCIDKTWHELRNNTNAIPFKFKCLENGKIYKDSEIKQCKIDTNMISNTWSYIKVEIRKCCDGKRKDFNGLHFEYA
jgi:group I intron endonuclease